MTEKTVTVISKYFKDNKNRLSDASKKSYGISLRQFFTYCLKDFDEVKALDIEGWHNHLDDQGLKPKSISTKLVGVQVFYKYCFEENLIMVDPAEGIEKPVIPLGPPRYLDNKQLATLREITREDLRARALIEALFATGARISEMLSVRLEDIKWDMRIIWIRKGKGDQERYIIMTTECAARLREYIKNRDIQSPYLFPNNKGGSLSTHWAGLLFRNLSEKLKFKVSPHMLRHSIAVHLFKKGMKQRYIQEVLGHESANSTKVYTRLNKQDKQRRRQSYFN